jgi:ribonuclease HI
MGAKNNLVKVQIYTDGSCYPNPGPGGWAAILMTTGESKNEKEIFGSVPDSTNNKMELTAVIKGLRALKFSCYVEVFTDSQYVKLGITEWISKWQLNGWKAANKKPVKNKSLWLELLEESKKHQITWQWVRGHNGDEFNERADYLAGKARENV